MKWSFFTFIALAVGLSDTRPQNKFVVTSPTPPPPTTTIVSAPDSALEANPPAAAAAAAPILLSELVTPTISQFYIRSDIQFRYARTVVETYFKNPDTKANKVTFSLVLPDKAFISNFSMLLGGEEFVARVETKEDAKDVFEGAVAQGQAAGIVEQDARNANQIVVSANVEAGGKTRFRLTYEELLQRRLERYEHVIYVNPGQIVNDFKVDVFINESLPLSHVFVPQLKEDPNAITSFKENPNAVVTRDPEDNSKVHIEFKPSSVEQKAIIKGKDNSGVAGQFIIQYDVDRKNQSSDVQVIDGYFVHFFAPDKLETLPKHIVFVLDVSGSMYGEKLQQTKDAMVTVIDDLKEQDSFNILTFSDNVYHWVPEAEKFKEGEHLLTYKGTKENRNEALKYVLGLNTIGGTNINQGIVDALKKVQEVQQSETLKSGTKPIVLFMTDGQATSGVTSKEEIKKNVATANENLKIPIYSLAFGRGADFSLIKGISQDNYAFARKIYEGSDAAIQLENFYLEIASPLLTGLNIEYKGELINASTITNAKVTSFNRGNEIVIAGKLNKMDNTVDDNEAVVDLMNIDISGVDKSGRFGSDIRICRPFPVPLPQPMPFPMPFPINTKPAVRTEEDVEQVETGELPQKPSFVAHTIEPIFIIPDGCVFPKPPPIEPRSEAQNFIERLWAFLTIKDLLDGKDLDLKAKKDELKAEEEEEEEDDNKENVVRALPSQDAEEEFPETIEMKRKDRALDLALKYNFVTELTSLVVVRPNATENDRKEILKPVPVDINGVRGGGLGSGCPGCFRNRASSQAQFSLAHMAMPRPPSKNSFSLATRGGSGPLKRRKTTTVHKRPAFTTTTYRPVPTASLAGFSMDMDDFMAMDDVFGETFEDESANVPAPPKTTCEGSISLYDQTYLRGTNITLIDAESDLGAAHSFIDRLTSLEVRGDCCWEVFSKGDFAGKSKVFSKGEYNSASQMGNLFRAASSVQRMLEC